MTETASELHPSEIARNEAEALKFQSEAYSRQLEAEANVRKADAEARKAAAEAEVVEIEAEADRHRLCAVEFDADRAREKRQEELAANKYHHVYLFDKDVNDGSVKACIGQLSLWERTSEGPIEVDLQLNSPGGDVVAGFALIDYIADMHQRGHTVNTTAYGMAASMAAVILQVGASRRMGSNAVLLLHEASFGAVGSYGEVSDRIKLVDIFHESILKLFADRSKVSKSFIKRNWTRKDWWCDSSTSLKHGFVDEVL